MTFGEIKNQSKREFTDISSEAYREYTNEFGTKYRIESPVGLSISSSAHYVIDAEGTVHRVPFDPAATTLTWKAKDGEPHIVA